MYLFKIVQTGDNVIDGGSGMRQRVALYIYETLTHSNLTNISVGSQQ